MSIIEFTLVNNDSSRIFLKLSGNKKPSEVSFKGFRSSGGRIANLALQGLADLVGGAKQEQRLEAP